MKNLILLLLPMYFFACSCESGNDPKEEMKDPRDFEWTVDTLEYPGSAQTLMSSIWAGSPEDVWVCGHNDQGDGKMFHNDGTSWQPVELFDDIELGIISVNDIFGTASYNIFAVGKREFYSPEKKRKINASLILRYNGYHWFETLFEETKELYSISGSSENNIWACGRDGVLYHFNGSEWELDTVIVKPTSDDINYGFYRIDAESDNVYILGSYNVNSLVKTTFYIYEQDQFEWAVVDSFSVYPGNSDQKFGAADLLYDDVLWSYGKRNIYEYNNGSWSTLFNLRSSIRKLKRFENQWMFCVGGNGMVGLYDTDWQYFTEFESDNLWYTDFQFVENEVFIVGSTSGAWPQRTLILHGK